ncbi:hypothetical protein LZC95_11925 [Pendulispora brunnea]|uniref:Uncharacterized protein n=1 Tax=Pendulispora brunnea TaxID=2905690 RepID=A0ABZ2KJN6_9BACT
MPKLEIDFGDIREYTEQERALLETSDERFDRLAFAQRALDLVNPLRTRIAICVEKAPRSSAASRGAGRLPRVTVQSGRAWGRGPGARWAILSIPAHASRRAIATAVSELAGEPGPYALDVLQELAASSVA